MRAHGFCRGNHFFFLCIQSPEQDSEIAQWTEWAHDGSVEWHLLEGRFHVGMLRWVADLNRAYRSEPALHELDHDPAGFEWIDANDNEASTLSFLRKAASTDDLILVVCNFTPVPRHEYLVGVPRGGTWEEILNSDGEPYGGSGVGNLGGKEALPVSMHGRPVALNLTLPPLGCVFLKNAAGSVSDPGPRSAPHGLASAQDDGRP